MTPALTELKRLVAMLETVRPTHRAMPAIVTFQTEAGNYTIYSPGASIPRAPWTWAHEDAEPGDTPARHGTARTFYDCLDEIMGDIDWNTCHQCRQTHDVEGNGELCAECLAEMADAEADAADNRLATIREAGL